MAETLATYSVPEHHVSMFTANVRASLTKKGGDLVAHVSRGSYHGDKVQLVNFIGPINFVKRTSPYVDTKLVEAEHTQRWLTGSEYDAAVLVDRLDTLKMLYDPTSPYVERMREGAALSMDATVMAAFFADAKSGKDASVTSVWNTANTVAHGGTGLTLSKLRSLRKLMKKRHVDLRAMRPLIAVTSEEVDDLLAETTTVSIDYNAVKPLVDGEVSQFMGFQFLPYESYGDGLLGKAIPTYTDSGTVRQLPVWTPDAMHFGMWDNLTIRVDNRPDKNNIKQIHGTFTCGATRVEDDKVFMVEAKE